jgi:hypothetical protein
LGQGLAGSTYGNLGFESVEFFAGGFQFLRQAFDALGDHFATDLQFLGHDAKELALSLKEFDGLGTDNGFNSSDSGCDSSFTGEGEGPNLSGVGHMGSSAKLDVPVANGHYSDKSAVFLAERCYDAGDLTGLIKGENLGRDGDTLKNALTDEAFDFGQIFRGGSFGMGEIETEPIGSDKAALLGDMVSENSF